jgi:hypothetical protein
MENKVWSGCSMTRIDTVFAWREAITCYCQNRRFAQLPILLRPLFSTKYVAFQVFIRSSVLAGKRCKLFLGVSLRFVTLSLATSEVEPSFCLIISSPHCMLDSFLGCSLFAALVVYASRASVLPIAVQCAQRNLYNSDPDRCRKVTVLRPRSGAFSPFSLPSDRFFSFILFSSS